MLKPTPRLFAGVRNTQVQNGLLSHPAEIRSSIPAPEKTHSVPKRRAGPLFEYAGESSAPLPRRKRRRRHRGQFWLALLGVLATAAVIYLLLMARNYV